MGLLHKLCPSGCPDDLLRIANSPFGWLILVGAFLLIALWIWRRPKKD